MWPLMMSEIYNTDNGKIQPPWLMVSFPINSWTRFSPGCLRYYWMKKIAGGGTRKLISCNGGVCRRFCICASRNAGSG
jgi:hypothetical protein